MMDWAGVAAVAAIGALVVAVIALSSNLVSRAIDKRDKRLEETIKGQGKLLEHYEASNGKEHARLEAKIDDVSKTLKEVRDIVIRLDDRQRGDRERQQAAD